MDFGGGGRAGSADLLCDWVWIYGGAYLGSAGGEVCSRGGETGRVAWGGEVGKAEVGGNGGDVEKTTMRSRF